MLQRTALCVGINRYQNFPQASLSGCVQDAQDMASLLKDMLGFEASNICLMTDESATKANILRGEPQKQHDGIAVTSDRMGAHSPLVGQVVLEESNQRSPKVVLVDGRHHVTSPDRRQPYDASKRSLAACASSGIHRR